jgi:protein-tyrosine phosphatase
MIDLHCHYLPGIDDGVRSVQDGIRLCQELHRIGFTQVCATPHIHSGRYANRKEPIREAFARFVAVAAEHDEMPELTLGAEHHFDDAFFELLASDGLVPYQSGQSILVELPPQVLPVGLEQHLFSVARRGFHPVLAHPERYAPLYRKTDPVHALVRMGVDFVLDVMSLTGHYGKEPQRAAERMLKERVYTAACSDAHRVSDVPVVQDGITRLRRLVGEVVSHQLLSEHPREILSHP